LRSAALKNAGTARPSSTLILGPKVLCAMTPVPAQKFSRPGTLKSYTMSVGGTSSMAVTLAQTRSP
jgi:hypothetical protein